MAEIAFPGPQNRTAVIGSTGSGKTQFAVFLLSTRDFHKRPWFIFDFKGDVLIEQLGAEEIDVTKRPPEKPGLYVVRPIPDLHTYAVSQFLRAIWENENAGIFIDEGYMIGQRDPWLNACLTQGRSKHIEMIILSQRPVWMSKYVFSEASFFAVFNLMLEDDRKHVRSYLGNTVVNLLPRYHCLWYDADRQQSAIFSPVPKAEKLIETFHERLQQMNTEKRQRI